MKRLLYSLLFGMLFSTMLSAQIDKRGAEWYYGFKAGATYSIIDEVATTLIRPIYPEETYNVNIEQQLGFTGGLFVYYRFRDNNNTSFAIQPELTYADQGGIFNYNDINGLDYSIAFQYNYLRLTPMVKIYLIDEIGLNIALGAELGFNLGTANLNYTSNMPNLGPDLQIQQSLRQVLKGRNNVGFTVGIGYELPMGLMISGRYIYGISDVIETQANGFYFVENQNRNTTIEATLSYAIPFFSW